MARITYYTFPSGAAAHGGVKMHVRHVETLRDLGFNAELRTGVNNPLPNWLTYNIPVKVGEPVARGDIVVLPEDAAVMIERIAGSSHRTVIFCQSALFLAMFSLDAIAKLPQPVDAITVGFSQTDLLRRILPDARIERVRPFADDRVFRPADDRGPGVAYMPKKRPVEPRMVQGLIRALHPSASTRPWVKIDGVGETEVAAALANSELYLSLARMESVGISTLEAMASGCVCAGFLGIGGVDYGRPENGFWAPDDDCEAAADALGAADELVRTGGVPLKAMIEAARVTAAEWSYERFRADLEETWMRLAPEARVRNGPLDLA